MSADRSLLSRHRDPFADPINRRAFLRSSATAAAFALTAQSRLPAFFAQERVRSLAPVKVARNRIIREIVGLRPFRSEGYVVEAQRIGNKLLVHNYGHGGAGITLSWGTATQAVDLSRDFVESRVSRSGKAARASAPLRFA